MNNNDFNNNIEVNNMETNTSYSNENVSNNHKGILKILLAACAIGIIILVIILTGVLSPKDSDSTDKTLSPEVEEEHKDQIYKAIDTYVMATATAVNYMSFGSLTGDKTIYYIPVSTNTAETCVNLENGTINPFGEKGSAYVGVVYRKEYYAYDYYFTFYDDVGYSMELTRLDDINKNNIVRSDKINKDNITTQMAEGTTKIVVLETPKQNPNNSCKAN